MRKVGERSFRQVLACVAGKSGKVFIFIAHSPLSLCLLKWVTVY